MTFVYEDIKEEDKKWVNFSKFKGIWNSTLGTYYSWSVDRDEEMALVGIDSGGRLGEDEYTVEAYGFYYKGHYINWTIRHTKYQDENGKTQKKWYSANIPIPDDLTSQSEIIIKSIKEAFLAYEEIDLANTYIVVEF